MRNCAASRFDPGRHYRPQLRQGAGVVGRLDDIGGAVPDQSILAAQSFAAFACLTSDTLVVIDEASMVGPAVTVGAASRS